MTQKYSSRYDNQLNNPISSRPNKSPTLTNNVNNLYSFLTENSIPVQNSSYNSISRITTNISPRTNLLDNIDLLKQPNQPSQDTVNSKYSQSTFSNTLISQSPISYQYPKYSDKTQEKHLQIPNSYNRLITSNSQRYLDGSSYFNQSERLKTQNFSKNLLTTSTQHDIVWKDVQTQTIEEIYSLQQNNNLQDPKIKEAISMTKQGHLQSQTKGKAQGLLQSSCEYTTNDSKPREAVSYFRPQQSDSQDNQPEQQTLMQLIFLNDPYIFQELEEIRQYKSSQKLINTISEVLNEEFQDLDQNSLENQQELNGRARVTLKLFSDILNKALEAFDTNDSRQSQQKSQTNDREQDDNLKFKVQPSDQDHFRAPWDLQSDSSPKSKVETNINQPYSYLNGMKQIESSDYEYVSQSHKELQIQNQKKQVSFRFAENPFPDIKKYKQREQQDKELDQQRQDQSYDQKETGSDPFNFKSAQSSADSLNFQDYFDLKPQN